MIPSVNEDGRAGRRRRAGRRGGAAKESERLFSMCSVWSVLTTVLASEAKEWPLGRGEEAGPDPCRSGNGHRLGARRGAQDREAPERSEWSTTPSSRPSAPRRTM